MKPFLPLLLATVIAGLSGCRNVGYNDQSLNNALTPGISEKQYTRTYPNGNGGPPTVTQTPPDAAKDPAYPNH